MRLLNFAKLILLIFMVYSSSSFASSLTGTWTGIVSNGNDNENMLLQFSSNGNFINGYGELTHVGQVQRAAPPGGGVLTVRVTQLDKQDDSMVLEQEVSFEKTANGYLQQDYARLRHEIKLTAKGLALRLTMRESAYTSDVSGLAGNAGDTTVATGILSKAE